MFLLIQYMFRTVGITSTEYIDFTLQCTTYHFRKKSKISAFLVSLPPEIYRNDMKYSNIFFIMLQHSIL